MSYRSRSIVSLIFVTLQSFAIVVHHMDLFLFSRKKQDRKSREEAFQSLFEALSLVYASAAELKPTWSQQWHSRAERDLPAKYVIGDNIVEAAAHDMRFAVTLLQRNRWKSVVQPLFEMVDDTAWSRFQDAASGISTMLIELSDSHIERLTADEQDWITAAVQEFDDATRRRRAAERNGTPLARRVAEGAYQPVYIAIQLSDRLIDRRRNELVESQ